MLFRLKKHITNLQKALKNSHPTYVLFLEIILGIFLTVISVYIFATIRSEVLEKELISYDTQISKFFFSQRSLHLTYIMIFISYLGGKVILIFGVLFATLFSLKHHKREAVLFLFILTMAVVINISLKNLTQRPRPNISPLVSLQDYSFPSGHAMNSFVFYTTLSYYIYHFTKSKKLAAAGAAASTSLILLIGISRIYLGVHYPTDVIAGYLMGFGWFVSVLLMEKTFKFYEIFKEKKEE